jgi:4,5-DOPA dioxygenase extradiol
VKEERMSDLMPALFIGHGSPMNAIESNEFTRAWADAAAELARPRGVLCVSAHWETRGVMVTAMERPRTIHDFYGFPRELFAVQYRAPGSPEIVEAVRAAARSAEVSPDMQWGLDHGAWSVLSRMFPQADVPVVQLSLDSTRPMEFHYELGKELGKLREEGILILGSGNIVHNLGLADFSASPYDWAQSFDGKVAGWIRDGNHQAIIRWKEQGRDAQLSVNSAEHFKPLLYVLGLQRKDERVSFFAESLMAGSLSMRSMRIG